MSQPTIYVLSREYIYGDETAGSGMTPLYHISTNLDALTHKVSSIYISRVIATDPEVETKVENGHDRPSTLSGTTLNPESIDQKLQQVKLYNLVHPLNAQYRTDIPAAYFMTASDTWTAGALGNIKLISSSPTPSLTRKYLFPFYKPTFTALLNPSSNSSTSPLFPEEKIQHLFTAKPTKGGLGGTWEWIRKGPDGKKQVVAREENLQDKTRSGGEEQQVTERKLIMTAPGNLDHKTRDALVALWVLRNWWAVAEEKEFQKETLMEMTPPESLSLGGMSKMAKRAGALGGFAAVGGAC